MAFYLSGRFFISFVFFLTCKLETWKYDILVESFSGRFIKSDSHILAASLNDRKTTVDNFRFVGPMEPQRTCGNRIVMRCIVVDEIGRAAHYVVYRVAQIGVLDVLKIVIVTAKVRRHAVLVQERTKSIDQALSGAVFGNRPDRKMSGNDDIGHRGSCNGGETLLKVVEVVRADSLLLVALVFRLTGAFVRRVAAHDHRVDHHDRDELLFAVQGVHVDGVVKRWQNPKIK